MSDVDRRTVLKGVAASAAAMSPVGEAFSAEPEGLQFEPPVPFSYELFKQQARERAHSRISRRRGRRRTCCSRSITRNGARSNTATPTRSSPMGRVPFRSLFSIWGCFFRRRSACTWSRAASRARSSMSRHISTCRPIRRRASCRKGRVSPGFVSRNCAMGRSTGARTTGSLFSAPPISARSAN